MSDSHLDIEWGDREAGLANANAIEGAWRHDISANNACVAFQLSFPHPPLSSAILSSLSVWSVKNSQQAEQNCH